MLQCFVLLLEISSLTGICGTQDFLRPLQNILDPGKLQTQVQEAVAQLPEIVPKPEFITPHLPTNPLNVADPSTLLSSLCPILSVLRPLAKTWRFFFFFNRPLDMQLEMIQDKRDPCLTEIGGISYNFNMEKDENFFSYLFRVVKDLIPVFNRLMFALK